MGMKGKDLGKYLKHSAQGVACLAGLILLASCIGKRSQLADAPATGSSGTESLSFDFDFSNEDNFSFEDGKLSFSNGDVELTRSVPGFYEDQFSDENASDWNGIAYPAATLDTLAESSGVLTAMVSGVTYAFALDSMPSVENSHTEVTVTPVDLTGGLKIVGVIARVTGSEYYLGATYSGSHKILQFNGTTFRQIGSPVATAIDPANNQSYHLAFEADGSSLKYKIWEDGDAEPAWLVEVTDNALSEGKSGFIGADGEVDFEDFTVEDIDLFGPPSFPEEAVALTFPEINLGTNFVSLDSLSIDVSEPEDSAVLFEFSLDSGQSWLVSDGNSWTSNAEGSASASTIAQINATLPSLDFTGGGILLRAYFQKSSSDQSPTLSNLQLQYTVSR